MNEEQIKAVAAQLYGEMTGYTFEGCWDKEQLPMHYLLRNRLYHALCRLVIHCDLQIADIAALHDMELPFRIIEVAPPASPLPLYWISGQKGDS